MFANAIKVRRKSGEAERRDLRFPFRFHASSGHGRSRAPFRLSVAARETTGAAPAAEPSSVAVAEALSNEAGAAPNSVSSASDVPRSSSAGYTTALEDRPRSAEDSSLAAVVG
jgi:hypothetical protein